MVVTLLAKMSRCPLIVTPRFIRRHNLRCFGRMCLWALGSLAVFLVVFLFVWLLASFFTGTRALTIPIMAAGCLVGAAVFTGGHLHLKRNGPQDWEKVAQKTDRKPGMRLSRLSHQEYGQVGQGFVALILAGPGWLVRVFEEFRSIIPARTEVAARLEELRQHLAARDAWVPMKDFSAHEADIYLLVRMDLLAIRELIGEWHFHVTLKGSVRRTNDAEIEA